MAGSSQKVLDKVLPTVKNEKSSSLECAVCLQTCIHPAELPCGHIFCYLCIKGIVNQGRPCAMCRRDIPFDYLHKPRLLTTLEAEGSNQGFEDGQLWFYEGHNGWWQYDERTSLELESAYQKGEKSCELLIAGFVYVVDFGEMLQYRRNTPNKRRRIKRDLATISKKGVAGLRTTKFTNPISANFTAGESNEVTQGWSITDAPTVPNSSSERAHTTVISSTVSEPISNHQQPGERILFGLSHSTCNAIPPGTSLPNAENYATYSRNFNFDNVAHETMDLSVEQIESLNSELLNDFEVLFRDVNSYGQQQSTFNQNRSGILVDNYLTRYLSRSYPLRRDSQNNDSEANYRGSNLSELSNKNNGSGAFSVSPREEFPLSEEHVEKKMF